MEGLEQATTIQGYQHPTQRRNKFSLIEPNSRNVEAVSTHPDYRFQEEQEERERMMREIEAKYQPSTYQHSQRPVCSSQSSYVTTLTLGTERPDFNNVRFTSKYWIKRAEKDKSQKVDEDKSQVMVRGENEYVDSFRKHMMPVQILRKRKFIFSSTPELKSYNRNDIILNEESVSVTSFHRDEIQKSGYRDKATKEGDKLFGTAVLSPFMREQMRMMENFVPAGIRLG